MIKQLSKFVKWLEVRFPEKLIVTEESYASLLLYIQGCETRIKQLDSELGMLRDDARAHVADIAAAVDRISMVESSAVHKGAVGDLVKVVAELKADLASFKTSIGFKTQAVNEDLSLMLNGEFINHGQD